MDPRRRGSPLLLAAAALLAGCAAFRPPRRPLPAESSIDVEGEGSGIDDASARQAARQDALRRSLELFVSTSAAPVGPAALADIGKFLGEGETVGSSRRRGRQTRRLRFPLSYRALAAELAGRGLLDPGGIVGRPKLLLALDESAGPPDAAELLKKRLDEAGFEALLSACAHPRAEARRLGARVLVQGSSSADPSSGSVGRLARQSAGYELTVDWIAAVSTAPAVVLPGRILERDEAYELEPADAADRAADNAARAVAARLRLELADRLVERSRNIVLVLSLGDLSRIRRFLAAVRALPKVDAASLDLVGGDDARFRVWSRGESSDELALRLKDLAGFHLVVRNVESPYGWIELDTEDDD